MFKFKRTVGALVAAAAIFTGSQVQGAGILEALALYIPNRVLDVLDAFSVGVGIGASVRAELMATKAIQVGAGYNFWSAKLFKDCNRQYGAGLQSGWYWDFISVGNESMKREHTVGSVKEYYESFLGVPDFRQPIYDYYDGARDYWQIGGALGLVVEGEVYINPLEWIDAAAGLILLDPKQDDLSFDNF